MQDEILKEFRAVEFALKEAINDGLEVEVVVFALKAMKENPSLSIEEAINIGYEEWIK